MNKLILIVCSLLLVAQAAYAGRVDRDADYYKALANTSRQISDALKNLEKDRTYLNAIDGLVQRKSDCRDLIMVRYLSLQPQSRKIVSLCRIASTTNRWSLESIDLGTGEKTVKKLDADLSNLVLSLRTHSMIGEPDYVLTDGSYAFITLRSDSHLYRHAVICPMCLESSGKLDSYRVLSEVVARVLSLESLRPSENSVRDK